MNDKKIAFIICSNDDIQVNECINWLNCLEVPEGIEVDILVVNEAKSMLLGMQEGSESTDAKYKVFLHQDVFILNKHFIKNIIQLFESDEKIGMIGMIGAPRMPEEFVMWKAQRVGCVYDKKSISDYGEYDYYLSDGKYNVDVVDGLLMATQYDIPFRTDLFDGWDFYDVSMSFECKRLGYKVVVPEQEQPWCLHDDGVFQTIWNYNKYRKIAMQEYADCVE